MRSKCGESFVVNRMKFDRIDDDRIVNEFVYRRVCVLITVCLRFDRSQSAGSAMIFCLQKKKSDVDTESGPQRQDIYCEVYLITWTNQGNKPDSVFLSVLISLDNNDSRSEVSNQNRLVQLAVGLNVWQVGRSYNLFLTVSALPPIWYFAMAIIGGVRCAQFPWCSFLNSDLSGSKDQCLGAGPYLASSVDCILCLNAILWDDLCGRDR